MKMYSIRQKKTVGKKMWMLICILLLVCGLTGCGKQEIVSHQAEQDSFTDGMNPEDMVDDTSENATENVVIDEETSDDDGETSSDEDGGDEYELKEVMVGDVAPEFSATLVDGSVFTLSENSGKVILLNFWATWCPPCIGEMPAFEDLDADYGEEVVILAVNCMEDEKSVNMFLEDTGYTFPIAYDVDGKVSFTYPSSGIPYTLVIGKDGIVKNIYVGAADADSQYQLYKTAIDAALSE